MAILSRKYLINAKSAQISIAKGQSVERHQAEQTVKAGG
jgi:hypothetical protein